VIDLFDHPGIDAIGWDAAVAVKGEAGNAKMDVGGEDDLDEGVHGGNRGQNGGPGKGWKKEQAAKTGEDVDHAIKITFMRMGSGYVLVNSS
jgi:DnaJ-class molecular chaperone